MTASIESNFMLRSARRLSLYLFCFLATLASATPAHAQTTALFLDSQPGDYVGQGVQRTYTPADGTFQISTFSSNAVGVSVTGPNFSFWWSLNFAAATGVPLTVGTYESARRSSSATSNGQDVFGSGRGCNQSTGRFVVREITRSPSGTVLAFAADFEQHCEDGAPGLFGAIRYNSTIGDLLAVRWELSTLSADDYAPRQWSRERWRCGLRRRQLRLPGLVAGRRAPVDHGYTRSRIRVHRVDGLLVEARRRRRCTSTVKRLARHCSSRWCPLRPGRCSTGRVRPVTLSAVAAKACCRRRAVSGR